MIEITNEMKNARQVRMSKIEKQIDERISNAVERKCHSTYFACDKDCDKDVYDEIRRKYENAGYVIKPTGYCGGVWQLTEDICW